MNKKLITFAAASGLILVTIIWGAAFAVVKNSLDYVPPIYMMAFRFTIAGIVMSLVFIKKLLRIKKDELIHGVGIGVFLFLAYAFQTIGCNYTTAGKNAFLTTVYVILVPFLNWILIKRRPDIFSIIAALLSITGIGLLSLEGDFTMNKGDVLTLICSFCYALQIIFIAQWSQNDDPVLLAIIQIIVAALLSWITAPFIDGDMNWHVLSSGNVILSMMYLGLLSTMVAFALQTICQKYLAPSLAALLMSFEAVFGALSGVIFLGEIIPPRGIVGCALMFFAVVLSETKFSFLRRRKIK
ncbi:MAG: DMT family transporter [Spirochaetaceae bacterium]|nr:DMT family transporter [Spirochaetaceae bacterium]